MNVMHSQGLSEPTAVLQRWGLVQPSNRGPRARLTLDEVIAAAVALADSRGRDEVTLAEVAGRLGMTTTAVYRYVDSKETLTELMVDAALGPAPVLDEEPGLRQVRAWVDALWGRYRLHPWLATFPLRRAPRCPHVFAWLDVLVHQLRVAGVEDALGTAMAVDVLVRGYAAMQEAAAHSELSPTLIAEVGRRFPDLGARPIEPVDELHAAVERLLS